MIPHLLYYTETGGIGGAERYFMELIRHSAQAAASTTVCVQHFAGDECIRKSCEQAGANFQTIPFEVSCSKRLAASLRLFGLKHASLIHFSLIGTASCSEALTAATLLRKRFLITEHRVGDEPSGGWKYHVFRRVITANAGRVIAVSSEDERRLVTHHGTSRAKITAIHNGVATCYFDCDPDTRIAYRRSLGISEDEVLFIQVAHLVGYKNPMLAVQAFGALPDRIKRRSRLMLVGDGPLRPSLQEWIEERRLDDRVHLLGIRDDVCELLKMADVFVLTSGDENCPFALLEAMASGLPVINTASGGPKEIMVDQETGFLVSDRDQLVRRMVQLFESSSLRQRLGCAGRDRAAKDFTLEAMVQKTHSLYAHVWNRRNSNI